MTNGMSTSTCGSSSASPVHSAKVFINSYTDLSDTSTWQAQISSGCYVASGSIFPSVNGPLLPQNSGNTFLAVTVKSYTDSGCGSLYNTYNFAQSLANSPTATGNTAYKSGISGSAGTLLIRDF
jgi:hypothetical protein